MKYVSIKYKLEKVFDKWLDKHEYADFHGIDINSLLDSILDVGKQADKRLIENQKIIENIHEVLVGGSTIRERDAHELCDKILGEHI